MCKTVLSTCDSLNEKKEESKKKKILPFGVFILFKSLRFSPSLDIAQNPQQNSELKLKLAGNILTDRAGAQNQQNQQELKISQSGRARAQA